MKMIVIKQKTDSDGSAKDVEKLPLSQRKAVKSSKKSFESNLKVSCSVP